MAHHSVSGAALRLCGMVAAAAVLAQVICLPVTADDRPDGYKLRERPPARLVQRRHTRPILPPEIAYRDPRYRPPAVVAPPVIVRAYLPRKAALPMYNEPPARFPQP
ncbi:hypothetical protein U8607_01785 [Methylobacterium durans]|uniref:hypothetical protein n=1 Tax=Methylobacterium durans TaxID=2202825 RepID=UPI002B000B55|nr:hypothetical protein [Methylobacterium durans]MEA1830803.1 hypothetical protein [Methylobacterium durans]